MTSHPFLSVPALRRNCDGTGRNQFRHRRGQPKAQAIQAELAAGLHASGRWWNAVVLAAIVKAHIAAYPPEPYELPWLKESGELADTLTFAVCCSLGSDDRRTNGRHIKFGSYNNGVWLPALAAAGVIAPPVKVEGRGLTYEGSSDGNGTHALRHFYSTTLQNAGCPSLGSWRSWGTAKGPPGDPRRLRPRH